VITLPQIAEKADDNGLSRRERRERLHDPLLYVRSGRVQVFFYSFGIKMLFKD
jgi:hypothetical protein